MIFPDPKPGDYLTAEMLNVLYDAIKNGISLVPPLVKNGDGSIALAEGPGFWVQFTGPPDDGAHPWQQQFAQPGGSWVNGPLSGTTTADPAYEINGSDADLSELRAKAWRDVTSAEVRFHFSACTS